MAATITAALNLGEQPSAPTFVNKYTMTFEASDYATGGYDLGLTTLLPGRTIARVTATERVTATGKQGARLWHYNPETGYLEAYDAIGTEEAASSDISASTVDLTVESY